MWAGYAVALASYALAVRGTWHRDRLKAGFIVLLLALPATVSAAQDLSRAWVVAMIVGAPLVADWIVNAAQGPPTSPPAAMARPAALAFRRRWVWAAIILIVLGAVFWMLREQALDDARRRVEALCAEALVGGPVEGLEARARALGLNLLADRDRIVAGTIAWIPYLGGRAYWCRIDHDGDKVTAKQTWSRLVPGD